MPLAERIEVTEIAEDIRRRRLRAAAGPEWRKAAREDHVSANGMKFSFVTYQK
jgi:dihydrofolate reductase